MCWGDFAYGHIAPALTRAYQGAASVAGFTDNASARRIRGAFTPDGTGGVYILSMDITEETQARVALQQTRRRTKLREDPKNPHLIKTIYGAGYIFLGDVQWT